MKILAPTGTIFQNLEAHRWPFASEISLYVAAGRNAWPRKGSPDDPDHQKRTANRLGASFAIDGGRHREE